MNPLTETWAHPCPFCGEKPKINLRDGASSRLHPTIVWCGNEDCVIWDLAVGLDDWNRRPVQAKIERALECLLAAAELVMDWRYGADDRYNYRKKWVRAIRASILDACAVLGREPPKLL
jgi:hypothetical protein